LQGLVLAMGKVLFDGNCRVKGLDCFLTSFGSGLGGGFTEKAGLSACALAAFSFIPKLKQAWLFHK
ncbi:hypothetical protein, partial [Muriicola sp.]|uniref:hypothetical protein n=1 Tax=Muriicola sp. TaxID=2020856 RepID=UPI003565DB3D